MPTVISGSRNLYYTTKRSRSAAQTTMMVSGGFCLSGQVHWRAALYCVCLVGA